jgi:hypothetical protein
MLVTFYTYCYLDKKGKPYYIGKGTGGRINHPHHGCFVVLPPPERRLFLKTGLTEDEAFKHEVYMIAVLGRKDLGLGPLVNLTNGGEGTSGWKMTQEVKNKIGAANSGRERLDMMGDNNPMRDPEIAKVVAETKRGKPRDEVTRKKIKRTLTGRKDSVEVKHRKSQAQKGKKKSEKHAENIRKAKTGTKYYVNFEGKVIVRKEHPGEGWQQGMKWKSAGN